MPLLKKFWQRILFYIILFLLFGVFFYWMFSQVNLTELNAVESPTRGERQMRFFLNLMSPEGWFWMIFLSGFFLSLAGDWWTHRFKNLPEDEPIEETEIGDQTKQAGKYRVTGFDRLGGYYLHVRFNDGSEQTIDFERFLTGPNFGSLKELASFNEVRIGYFGRLEWPNGATISPDILHDWPEHVEAIIARRKTAS